MNDNYFLNDSCLNDYYTMKSTFILHLLPCLRHAYSGHALASSLFSFQSCLRSNVETSFGLVLTLKSFKIMV